MRKKERLLFFDIVRISAIILVVSQHILGTLTPSITIPDYETIPIGKIGVIIFVFISGAILYVTSEKMTFNIYNILIFYYKKFLRLYPAMWLSLLVAIMLNPGILQFQTLKYLLIQLSGTPVYFLDFNTPNIWTHLINPLTYFIGLIAGLYLIYPIIHIIIKKYPHHVLIGTMTISIISTTHYHITIFSGNPLAYLMYFVLGTYIAYFRIYPKSKTNSNVIIFLSELSFYIFLTHTLIVNLWKTSPILYIVLAVLIAYILMLTDNIVKMKLEYIFDVIKASLGEKYERENILGE
jgi:peptidoglycan/LPS O-acetylase OafA/YrhL